MFEIRYETEPDLAHLRAFGVPYSIVEPLDSDVEEVGQPARGGVRW